MSQRGMEEVNVAGIDYDGCLHEDGKQAWKCFKEDMERRNVQRAYIDTTRQGKQLEYINVEHSGYSAYGSYETFTAAVNEDREESNAPMQLSKLLLEDAVMHWPPGTAFRRAKEKYAGHEGEHLAKLEVLKDREESSRQEHACFKRTLKKEFQRAVVVPTFKSKMGILYQKMQDASAEYPNKHVHYRFCDDRQDILSDLDQFYITNPTLIPSNVTLYLNHYDNTSELPSINAYQAPLFSEAKPRQPQTVKETAIRVRAAFKAAEVEAGTIFLSAYRGDGLKPIVAAFADKLKGLDQAFEDQSEDEYKQTLADADVPPPASAVFGFIADAYRYMHKIVRDNSSRHSCFPVDPHYLHAVHAFYQANSAFIPADGSLQLLAGSSVRPTNHGEPIQSTSNERRPLSEKWIEKSLDKAFEKAMEESSIPPYLVFDERSIEEGKAAFSQGLLKGHNAQIFSLFKPGFEWITGASMGVSAIGVAGAATMLSTAFMAAAASATISGVLSVNPIALTIAVLALALLAVGSASAHCLRTKTVPKCLKFMGREPVHVSAPSQAEGLGGGGQK